MINRRFQTGFTLIELMIALVIGAILAAIAYPSYQDSVRKARRSDGQALLLDAANREERFFADGNTYTRTVTDLGYANPAKSQEGHYQLGIVVGPAGCDASGSTTSCTFYKLTATAQDAQASDGCGNLELKSTGDKSATGTGNCW